MDVQRRAGTLRREMLDHREAPSLVSLEALIVARTPRNQSASPSSCYRHFPDESTLARACSGQYFERHPFPDPDSWKAIPDPIERLRTGLREAYAYHRATEAMMAHVLADARDRPVVAPYHAHWQRAADVLAAPWRARGRQRTLLRGAMALALSFDTWRTLVREQQLADDQAVELMFRLTCD